MSNIPTIAHLLTTIVGNAGFLLICLVPIVLNYRLQAGRDLSTRPLRNWGGR